ncbi:MAG: hypothetical protein ACFFAE_11375 [Candidatus Hodarchaeota archaeon]
MRSTNVIVRKKNWPQMKVFRLMMVIVICLPSILAARPATLSSATVLEKILDPEDLLKEVSDLNQLQDEACDQISNLINPVKETFPLHSIEYSNMSNVILNELYTRWISNPTGYSFVEQEVLGWDITNIQTPEQAVSIHETTSEDGRKTTVTTIYSERPYLKILDSGDSFIDDIIVPVLPENGGTGAYVPEYATITKRINFGWILPSAKIDKSFYYSLWGKKEGELSLETMTGARLKVWVKFDFQFHLLFPVEVTICYPTRIFEGQAYEFNCTVVPINDPAMKEFKFLINAEAGWNVKAGLWLAPEVPPVCLRGGGYHCHDSCCSQLCFFEGTIFEYCLPEVCIPCNCHWHCAGEDELWFQLMGKKFSLADELGKGKRYTALSGDYKTPLGSDPLSLSLPLDIDILDIIGHVVRPLGILAEFFSLELGLGTADIYGDAVRAKMSILSDVEEDRDVAFADEAGETARMKFTIPDSEQTPNVKFSVTQFEYDFKRIEFNPYFYAGFDDIEIDPPPADLPFPLGFIDLPPITLPLRDEWGGYTHYFEKFDIPAEASIDSKFAYYSDGISVTEDYSAIYDFTMDVRDWYSGYTPYGYIQRYLIDLSNPNLNNQQNDVIKLSVSGLPEGYEAEFDAPQGEYRLSGESPTVEEQAPQSVWSDEYPKWAINTVYSPFGADGINRALLTISKTGSTDAPPGEWPIDIIANSTQRVNHNLLDPAIIKNAILDVSEFHGIDFQLVDTLYDEILVFPGTYFPIGFFGQNLGNVPDIVNVSASIDLGNSEKTWNEIFTLEPYGSTANQFFSGQFTFTYDRTDLFPSPGVYLLELTVNSSKTALIDVTLRSFLTFTKAYGVESSISPISTTIFANWEQNFTLLINNTGNVLDNITIESHGWDDYLTFPKRITDVSPMNPQEVTISLSIANPGTVSNDTYQFRIIVKSEGAGLNSTTFSFHDVYVTILEPDYVPPGIVQVFKPCIDSVEYPQSPLTFGPRWMAFDEWNDTYTIYINGTVYESGGWTEGIPIQAPVTGINPLPPGLYNVTIAFSDVSNNIASAQTWVRVKPLDTTFPLINPLPGKTVFPVNFSQPQSFYWNCTEENIYNFQILVNGTPVNLTWQYNLCMRFNLYNHTNFKFNYTIHPQTLSEGPWNITFVIQDKSNNIASDTVIITIAGADSAKPSIIPEFPISSANLGYGTKFNITATDAFPDKYTLWVGTTLLSSGAWESGVSLIFNADDIGLMVGDNDLRIDFIDLADNLASYQWTFSFSDIDTPTLLAAPPNLILYEHNYTRLLPPFWSVEDLDPQPGTFTINLDGVTIAQGFWSNANGTLELPIPYLLPGTHHYDAYFRDASGNTLYSPVDLTLYDITKPSIIAVDNIRFEPLYSADWFEFYISELHPAQFSLYRNSTLVNSEPLTGFPYVFVRIIDLSTGSYNYTMVVEDESGNLGQLSIRVHVTDYTPPVIVRPLDMIISEGAPDQVITWKIREANPQTYSLYRNDVLLESGSLTESILIHSLAGLVVGEYTYTLIVSDTHGQSHTSTSYVTVLDMTPPTLSRISDCRFVKNDPNADIVWQVYDLHPSSYFFTINGEAAPIESWDGSEITLHCTGWSEGNYTVLLQVSDLSGNLVSDEIKVEIFLEESKDVEPSRSPGFGFIGIILVLFLSIVILRRKKKPFSRSYICCHKYRR